MSIFIYVKVFLYRNIKLCTLFLLKYNMATKKSHTILYEFVGSNVFVFIQHWQQWQHSNWLVMVVLNRLKDAFLRKNYGIALEWKKTKILIKK